MLRRPFGVPAFVGVLAILLATAGVAGAATRLDASLSGRKEVPKAGNGTGTAHITLKPRKRQVCFNITLHDVGSVEMGHIHKGGRGVAGDIVVPLFDSTTRHPQGCASAKRSVIRAIRKHPSRYYVNVHNARFPAGAARGQLHR
jgi:CHRD domain-containing protein